MKEILNKIYPYNAKQAITDILKLYEKQGFVVSNFIYFAVIKTHKLFESTKKTTTQKEYKKAIMQGDFLFPDGIALQIFYILANKKFYLSQNKLSNLNGTDFVPYFLDEIKKSHGSQKICLFLYGAKPDIVEETKNQLIYKGLNIVYYQDGYSEFDRSKVLDIKKDYQDTINILLVAMSTPNNPIQELRTIKNKAKIKENNFLVFTVGGLFDFIAAESDKKILKKSVQKRAPKFIRHLKLEWLWRLITDPKRNFKKVKSSFYLFPYIFKYLLLKKE